MVKTIEVKIYSFDELPTEKAKDKARDWMREGAYNYDWWDSVYEDAATIGLKITAFDCDRASTIEGDLTESVSEVASRILANHGKSCDTYKLAMDYYKRKHAGNADAGEKFKHDLLEEYLVMLRQEAEYLVSEESIDETLRANDYEFLEDGSRSHF